MANKTQYNKKYVKNWRRKNKETIKAKALEDAKLYGKFDTTQEVFDNLIVPVPYFSEQLQSDFLQLKLTNFYKRSPEKVLFSYLHLYFSDKHYIHEDAQFIGIVADLQKQYSSHVYEKLFSLLTEKIPGVYIGDKTKTNKNGVANAYIFKEHIEWAFLSYNDAIEYVKLLGDKKFQEAISMLKKDKGQYNATTERMALLIKKGFKINNFKKDFTSEINACYIRKIKLEKPILPKFEVDKLKKRFGDEFPKIRNLTLEEIVKAYYNKKKLSYKNLMKRMEITESEDIKQSILKNARKIAGEMLDAEKLLKSLHNNELVFGELSIGGREFNLLTQMNKNLRELVMAFLGFNFEIDLKFSLFQLFKDQEIKFFKTSVLSEIYDNFDNLVAKYAEDLKVQRNMHRKPLKKTRKYLKRYFTSVFMGMNPEYVNSYLADSSFYAEILEFGKKIATTGARFTEFFVENKLDFYKKDSNLKDKVTADNILYYEYIAKEQRVISEMSKKFSKTFRVHDALFVATPKDEIKTALEDCKYDFKIKRITANRIYTIIF